MANDLMGTGGVRTNNAGNPNIPPLTLSLSLFPLGWGCSNPLCCSQWQCWVGMGTQAPLYSGSGVQVAPRACVRRSQNSHTMKHHQDGALL